MFTNKGGILCDIFVCCPGVSHAVKTQPGSPTSVADLGSSASTGQRSMFCCRTSTNKEGGTKTNCTCISRP